MARIKIDKDKCKGCMLCVSACPNGLIAKAKNLNRRGIHCVEFSASSKKNKKGCTGCSMCAVICPEVCIEVYK
ncbi:MAG: 4Fe-4S binding protein [Candidatus Omnitrophica bacterium]|nr:4Fe-4S binding protein [Candidatus Omnitrophota bacterium]